MPVWTCLLYTSSGSIAGRALAAAAGVLEDGNAAAGVGAVLLFKGACPGGVVGSGQDVYKRQVQIIPHITNEIKSYIYNLASSTEADVVIACLLYTSRCV